MTTNPYESPELDADELAAPKRSRPRGLNVVAAITLYGSFVTGIDLLTSVRPSAILQSDPRFLVAVGVPTVLFCTSLGWLAGQRWAWWVGCLMFCSGAVSLVANLVTAFAPGAIPHPKFIAAQLIAILVVGLFIAYFFAESVFAVLPSRSLVA